MRKYIFMLMFGMLACQVSTERDLLLEEINTIHDEAMAKMEEVIKLKKKLEKIATDSVGNVSESHIAAITDLEQAHEGMMVWMREFSKHFTSHHDHNHDSGKNSNGTNKLSPNQELGYLSTEKIKAKKVQKDIEESIIKAQKILTIK